MARFFIVSSLPAITKINPLKSATVTRFIASQYITITPNNERSQCEVLRFSAWLFWCGCGCDYLVMGAAGVCWCLLVAMRYLSGRVGNTGMTCWRWHMIITLARRLRAGSGLPTDALNHVAKAVCMAQGLRRPPASADSFRMIADTILGISRSVST